MIADKLDIKSLILSNNIATVIYKQLFIFDFNTSFLTIGNYTVDDVFSKWVAKLLAMVVLSIMPSTYEISFLF